MIKIFNANLKEVNLLTGNYSYTDLLLAAQSNYVKYGYIYTFLFDSLDTNIETNPIFNLYKSIDIKRDLISNYDIHILQTSYPSRETGDSYTESKLDLYLVSKDTFNIEIFKHLYKFCKDKFGRKRFVFDDKETLSIISINTGTSADDIYSYLTDISEITPSYAHDLLQAFDITKTGSIIRFKLRK